MGQDKTAKIKQDLGQIADMLVLNGTLTECSGLVHGKMGIAVFFFHYARCTGNELFADYAMDFCGIESGIQSSDYGAKIQEIVVSG